jgi:hypothetical protein
MTLHLDIHDGKKYCKASGEVLFDFWDDFLIVQHMLVFGGVIKRDKNAKYSNLSMSYLIFFVNHYFCGA